MSDDNKSFSSKIKELTVYTNGDAAQISTWSNVPYFFTETLQQQGIIVNRVNLQPPFLLRGIYKVCIFPLLKLFHKNTTYTFYRTRLNYWIQRMKIKQAIKQFPNAQAHIFLSFSFSAKGLSDKPTVLFGDWTYDHYFRYFENRKPNALEQTFVDREDSLIESADLVFPLFPGVANYMQSRYNNKNIHYIGNVVNTLYEAKKADILPLKKQKNSIVFIGSAKYKTGAINLVAAFEAAKKIVPDLQLHIIGMNDTDFSQLPEGVHCYGYLDKANEKQKAQYYTILKNANVFINPHPKWGAFSASIEAMYYFTPVIVTPYIEYVVTFGKEIPFGAYYNENTGTVLSDEIIKVLQHPEYEQLCKNAHEAVKEFTWNTYISKIVKEIQTLSN